MTLASQVTQQQKLKSEGDLRVRSSGLWSEVGQGIKSLKPGERERKELPHQGERTIWLLEKDSAGQEQVQGDGDTRGAGLQKPWQMGSHVHKSKHFYRFTKNQSWLKIGIYPQIFLPSN